MQRMHLFHLRKELSISTLCGSQKALLWGNQTDREGKQQLLPVLGTRGAEPGFVYATSIWTQLRDRARCHGGKSAVPAVEEREAPPWKVM